MLANIPSVLHSSRIIVSTLIFCVSTSSVVAESVEVTMDNYVVAETDWYFHQSAGQMPRSTRLCTTAP